MSNIKKINMSKLIAPIAIFDCDFTLWDTDWKKTLYNIAVGLNVPENLREELSSQMTHLITYIPKGCTTVLTEGKIKERIAEAIDLQKYGINVEDFFKALKNPEYFVYSMKKTVETTTDTDAAIVFKYLYELGVKITIKTTWFKEIVLYVLQREGLLKYVPEENVFALENEIPKPNACSLNNNIGDKDPNEVIIVGDSPTKEMAAANNYNKENNTNIISVWLNDKEKEPPKDEVYVPTYTICRLAEITEIVD